MPGLCLWIYSQDKRKAYTITLELECRGRPKH